MMIVRMPRQLRRTAGMLACIALAACAPERDLPRADSSPDQAGTPVPPPVGATAGAAPAPTMPETVQAKAGGRSTPRPRNNTSRTGATTRAGRDTLEYDRAIEYKADPRKELPAVKP